MNLGLGLALELQNGKFGSIYDGLIKSGATMILDPNRADGKKPGTNVPFTNPLVDLANKVGKNLFDGFLESGGINNATGVNIVDASRIRTVGFTSVNPNTTYAVSINGVLTPMAVIAYDANKNYISLIGAVPTFTTPSNCAFVRWHRTSTNLQELWQLELGSTATTYEPYARNNALLQNFVPSSADGYDTIPVKGIGEPISYTNLVTNGDFVNGTTGWTVVNATQVIESGRLAIISTAQYGRSQQDIPNLIIGKRYSVTVTIEGTINNYAFIVGIGTSLTKLTTNGIQRLSFVFTATATTHQLAFGDDKASAWAKFWVDNAMTIMLTDNPQIQALESKLGRQLTAPECDMLFAFTPTTAEVLAKTVTVLNLDGSNSFGALASSDALNPVGSDDFAQLVVFQPVDLGVRFWGVSRNASSPIATTQYGLYTINDGRLFFRFAGAIATQILPSYSLNLQWVLYGRINGRRFAIHNNNSLVDSVSTEIIVSEINTQLCCSSSTTDGLTKATFAKGYQGICAFWKAPNGQLDKNKIVAECAKFCAKQYGL
jgi:hypothetical protein